MYNVTSSCPLPSSRAPNLDRSVSGLKHSLGTCKGGVSLALARILPDLAELLCSDLHMYIMFNGTKRTISALAAGVEFKLATNGGSAGAERLWRR